jgi:hypothetical protein
MMLRFKREYPHYPKGSIVTVTQTHATPYDEKVFYIDNNNNTNWGWLPYHNDFEILEPPKPKIDPEYERLYT